MTKITFDGNTHTEASLKDLSGPALVSLYNDLMTELRGGSDDHVPQVRRFADKATAVTRTWKLLQRFAETQAEKEEPVNVTDAEFIALQTCLNYDNRESQLSDNFSNGDHAAFKKALGWNDQAVAALIGSLESKGLVYSDNEGVNGNKFNTVWLTEKGVNVVFDQIDAGRKAEAPKAKAAAPAKPKAEKAPRARKGTNLLPPGGRTVPCREGSKQAILLDMLARPNGATMAELIEALSGGKKPWTEATVRSGFGWDMKHKGYGVRSQFDADGTERFFIVVPEGFSVLPHRPLKSASKVDARQKRLDV
ncbi:hypothetical protein LK3_37 [Bordetella phage LK3]|uniref:Uncharacterized protein n=1 Tax=Bordetella phage LK3 TaxID=1926943 RepID=A0A2D0W8T6_9CAUD|nr:hypothetical protein LK3_37 [Bordetella phage LK3]